MSATAYDEAHCDHSGRCIASAGDRAAGLSNCVCCGKQLELHDGLWFTWEARFLPPEERRPQDEESDGRA